jgi:hypothetical protein
VPAHLQLFVRRQAAINHVYTTIAETADPGALAALYQELAEFEVRHGCTPTFECSSCESAVQAGTQQTGKCTHTPRNVYLSYAPTNSAPNEAHRSSLSIASTSSPHSTHGILPAMAGDRTPTPPTMPEPPSRQPLLGLKGRMRPKKLGKLGEESSRSPSPSKPSESEQLAAAANAAAEAGVPFAPKFPSSALGRSVSSRSVSFD